MKWLTELFSTATLLLINSGAVGLGVWVIREYYADLKLKHKETETRIKILEQKAVQTETQEKNNKETFSRIDNNIQRLTDHILNKK